MTTEQETVAAVEEVYRVIDETVAGWMAASDRNSLDARTRSLCHACGKCCDFASYDHKLFVTSPEMLYLIAKIGRQNVLRMSGGACPYQLRGECTIHLYRFAGCRIFYCKANSDAQSQLSEWAASQFRAICGNLGLDYSYTELGTALQQTA
jgi:hypothetical protein